MLRIRTDVLDFSRNPDEDYDIEEVPVYRRVDKVVRCFRPTAIKSNVEIKISGGSRAICEGPNVFEIIPYILIDNAVKYAPQNSTIDVTFSHVGSNVEFTVKSIGPRILENEREKIFDKGFRASAAKRSVSSGSGIGLYLASTLINQFAGSISVDTSTDEILTSDGSRCEVEFRVRIPFIRIEEQQRRKHWKGSRRGWAKK